MPHSPHRLRSSVRLIQKVSQSPIVRFEKLVERGLSVDAEICHPLLMKLCFSEHWCRVLSEFGHIDDHATQVEGHPLLQQVHTYIGHDRESLTGLKTGCGRTSEFTYARS